MTVYVETNFVLELALLQEQHTSCEQIVVLAVEEQIRLVIPAYSLVEPHETLTRFFKKRQAITEEVRNELRQLGRSAPYEEQTAALEELTALFIRSQMALNIMGGDYDHCPICLSPEANVSYRRDGVDAVSVDCSRCGQFQLSRTLAAIDVESKYGPRWMLSAAIRNR